MKSQLFKINAILCGLLLSVNSMWAYWTTDRSGNPQADNASIQGYVSKSGSTYYVLNDATERSISLNLRGDHVEYNYNINGPAATLTFDTKRERRTAIGNLHVAQRVIGGGWSDKYDKNPGTSYEGSGNISLDENAVELSFYSNDIGGAKRYFKDVKVTMASYCTPEQASIAFGSKTYLSSENKTLKIYWSNMGTQSISVSGDAARFTLSTASVPSKAGFYGNTVVTITYKRDAVGSHTMNLTINGQTVTVTGTTTQATPRITTNPTASAILYQAAISGSAITPGVAKHPTLDKTIDGTWTWQDGTQTADAYKTYTVVFTPDAKYGGGYSTQTCTIAIPVTKQNQTINWPLVEGAEYATGTLMGATATSGLAVTYTSNHPEWGYINENGRLVVVEPNKEITITASQAGNNNWNAAADVTKTFITLGANPNQYTDVHASNITYGAVLDSSKLSGKVYLDEVEIAGTLSWVDPMIMPVAGTANHMVLFTPTNTAAYSSVYFEVSVTVAKADPIITWNIGAILREEVRYDHFVESSNKEQSFSVSSPSSLLTISGTTLYTGSVDTKQTGLTLTFTQAASANYNAVSETKTVAIYPKSESCLPFEPMTEYEYNQAKIAQDGNVNWCNTDAEGSEKWLDFYTVHFTQYKGIAIGSWQGGFNYDEKYIDLFFSGIPENISFKAYLQTVTTSEHVHWPATAGEVTVMESEDGSTFTTVIGSPFNASSSGVSFSGTLKSETRYVRLIYSGNFTCYFQNVNITQKKYLTANKSELTFGTETNPLQEPQAITLSYSSLGVCGGKNDSIAVTSSNPAFYVDEATITENVGIEQKGSYTIRVRCNDIDQEGTLTFTSNDGTSKEVSVRSTNPPIRTAATDIFQTGTEHNPVSGTAYRAQRTLFTSDILDGLFDGSTPLFDTLYIYGVSESDTTSRAWEYSPVKGYKVPVVNASNVHTPCFVYKKDGAQYTYVRTFDASIMTLNIADSKTRGFVGYRSEAPAATAIQLSGANAELYLNNTEIVASGAPLAVNATSKVHANGTNILSSTGNAAVQLAGATNLSIEDTWTGTGSAILALRPAASYPSIDLGSGAGKVTVNGTQLELHNASHMAIAHMDGTTERYDGEVQINDGSIGGEATLGMPKRTFIDGGTFNDGTVEAYTVKGMPKRPRNSRGEMLSRHTMTKAALESGYAWYGQAHLTLDGAAKVNPMLMDETVWIFNGDDGEDYSDEKSWNKDGLPTKDDDVLINAPMVIAGGEMKVKSLTINWENKGKGIPAVTVNPDGGLTVGQGGIDALKVESPVDNLALKAGQEGDVRGQTGFLRIDPNAAEPMPSATIELYSTAYYDMNATDHNETGAWQFVGYPLTDGAIAKAVFSKSFLYDWNVSTGEWENNRKTCVLQPFEGYATSQYRNADGWLTTFAGQIVQNVDKVINLTYNEGSEFTHNMVANSYSAPIDITKFEDSDFEGIQAAVYMFNTGSRADIKKLGETKSGSSNTPGQYLSIPIGSAAAMKGAFETPTVIAPMQGFCVHATEAGAKLRLDYEKLVYNATNKNTPLHVVAREQEQVGSLCVSIYAEGVADNLYLLESDQYVAAYENGYDAKKMESGEANIFAIEGTDHLAVDATNSIVGTRIGVRTGDTTAYVMTFTHLNGQYLALLDSETNEITEINEGTQYTFFAVPNSMITERFQIVASANAPSVTTGVDQTNDGAKAQKFIRNGQLYILKNGVLYNATGAIVR